MLSACRLKSLLVIENESLLVLLRLYLESLESEEFVESDVLSYIGDGDHLCTVRVNIVELCRKSTVLEVFRIPIGLSGFRSVSNLCFEFNLSGCISKEHLEIVHLNSITLIDLISCETLGDDSIVDCDLDCLETVRGWSCVLLVARNQCQSCYSCRQHQFCNLHN